MKRHSFIKTTLAGLSGSLIFPSVVAAPIQNDPKPLEQKLVKEFVSAGHRDIKLVKEMLEQHPNLLSSRYDWGNGDFEEAIEGAGHVGHKEMAEFLIEQGARVNLFVLTMLGKTSLVKPILTAYPQLIFAGGAHGFTLLHHAIVGGAEELQEFLSEQGLKERKLTIK